MKFWIAILFTAVLFSCEQEKPASNIIEKRIIKPEEAEDVAVSADIVRLDKDLFAITSKEDMALILISNPVFFKQYLRGIAKAPKPEDIERMFAYYNNPGLRNFGKEVEANWGDMKQFKSDLASTFRLMEY